MIIVGIVLAALLTIAVIVDLRDRARRGKRIAGGLGQARRDDIQQNPQTGDPGAYVVNPSPWP